MQFGKNVHELGFQSPSRLHESEGRVLFEVFEKLNECIIFAPALIYGYRVACVCVYAVTFSASIFKITISYFWHQDIS